MSGNIVPTSRHLLPCLLLAGCASAPITVPAPDCGPIPYPTPLSLQAVEPVNAADHWELTHEDYVTLRTWVIDIDRYLEDVRTMTRWMESCLNDTKEITQPEEKSWWQIWKK